jgi:hypothetical protein
MWWHIRSMWRRSLRFICRLTISPTKIGVILLIRIIHLKVGWTKWSLICIGLFMQYLFESRNCGTILRQMHISLTNLASTLNWCGNLSHTHFAQLYGLYLPSQFSNTSTYILICFNVIQTSPKKKKKTYLSYLWCGHKSKSSLNLSSIGKRFHFLLWQSLWCSFSMYWRGPPRKKG